jgi:hypothetical protein
MILPKRKDKTSYTHGTGETDVGPSRHRKHLLQRTQMDKPVLGAPAIILEILGNHLEQHWFSERNIRTLQRCDMKIFPDYNSGPTKFVMPVNSPSVNLVSRFQLIAWRRLLIVHVLLPL